MNSKMYFAYLTKEVMTRELTRVTVVVMLLILSDSVGGDGEVVMKDIGDDDGGVEGVIGRSMM